MFDTLILLPKLSEGPNGDKNICTSLGIYSARREIEIFLECNITILDKF
jgi:hypothetical protein